jgi:hypothetical protein
MPDYSKSKIYRVYCGDDEYIGSTTRPLSERMNEHRCEYKRTRSHCRTNLIFEKHGVENCKIELIEDYPCERKEQLNRREGEIQRERECNNLRIECRTKAEYRVDNTEQMKQYQKEHYIKNRERKLAYDREKRLQKKALII